MYYLLTYFTVPFHPYTSPCDFLHAPGQELVSTMTALCLQFYFGTYTQP